MASISANKTPYRQIRALFDNDTITVYQAYSSTIATAAVEAQKLNTSPSFSTARMTWIKPSWAWVLYRSGYSYKDSRQSHILALKLKREVFIGLLRRAVLSHGKGKEEDSGRKAKSEGREKPANVRVQWDPERTIRLEKLEYRSIQIGIPGALVKEFMDGIVGIEDVTERARELKRVLDEEGEDGMIGIDELIARRLVLNEREFDVDEELREILAMDAGRDF
ncbi:uncharacterized protein BDR25DRAFT_387349 [Lindgomyces ingoldianus]|uniref:Uncharacterized protein n=1 Tax=Lindgomyces ingoldianus TaxID=673940 RepID=A0ACB6R2A1_9PLEO|nr:uncharacterized protein BDR25DRAFT_387349 [Lindgomyces ingoldianus]KAF2473177.1 hypothetical protein BDR25DRAFT_387349 [Lindgomyces ingoldianus]